MRLPLTLAAIAALLASCDCPEMPTSWNGAKLDSCSESGDTVCCSYSDDRCSYVVCQTGCGEAEERSWACL